MADLVKISDLPTTASTTQLSTTNQLVTSNNLYTSTTPPKDTLQEVMNSKLSRPVSTLQIECRFQLYVNNPRAKFIPYSMESVIGSSRRRARREVIDEQKKIYDSYNEKDDTLKETLTVSRSFSEINRPGKHGGLQCLLD